MKEIKRDKKVEEWEATRAKMKKTEKEIFDKAMKGFRESMAYQYILGFFDRAEKRIIDEIEQMQQRDIKEIFMLPKKEKELKIESMSKRDIILTGTLSIIKDVKSRL